MRQFNLRSKDGTTRVVTDFPWIAKQVPCPWDESRYARVMIPFNATEQKNHKHAKQHTQIVRRERLTIVRPVPMKVA